MWYGIISAGITALLYQSALWFGYQLQFENKVVETLLTVFLFGVIVILLKFIAAPYVLLKEKREEIQSFKDTINELRSVKPDIHLEIESIIYGGEMQGLADQQAQITLFLGVKNLGKKPSIVEHYRAYFAHNGKTYVGRISVPPDGLQIATEGVTYEIGPGEFIFDKTTQPEAEGSKITGALWVIFDCPNEIFKRREGRVIAECEDIFGTLSSAECTLGGALSGPTYRSGIRTSFEDDGKNS